MIHDQGRRDVAGPPGNDMPPCERALSEQRLRQAVLAGDEQAWQALYDGAFAELFAYVHWRCGGCPDLTDDAVQETWLVAVRRLRDFDPEQGPFLAWLRGIAANVIRNLLRARQAAQASSNGVATASARDERQRREEAEHVARVLADLPERYEAVLRAKYLEQHSVDEIAALWRETPKAIESLLTRARQAFRSTYGVESNLDQAIREQRP
jgi:RNA polymerase sigma-70 factor (ECF subfamily)